jgi:hypothetical protein
MINAPGMILVSLLLRKTRDYLTLPSPQLLKFKDPCLVTLAGLHCFIEFFPHYLNLCAC